MSDSPRPHAPVPLLPEHWDRHADPHSWPWTELPALGRFLLADGSGPASQATEVHICHDWNHLHAFFVCADHDIWGTFTERDDPIYDEEVVELFLAPGSADPVDYFEFEVSPNAVLLDARVHNPTGRRADMEVDFDWNCPGIRWQARRDDVNQRWQAGLSIPLSELVRGPDIPHLWRAAFYRIERPRDGVAEFSCWSPTLVEPANFHVPARFGSLILDDA